MIAQNTVDQLTDTEIFRLIINNAELKTILTNNFKSELLNNAYSDVFEIIITSEKNNSIINTLKFNSYSEIEKSQTT